LFGNGLYLLKILIFAPQINAQQMKPIVFQSLIIFQDDNYLVVNKPAGISTLNERTEGKKGLIDLAREFSPTLSPCHRLDKETSGVLVFSKNQEAYRHMAIQLEKREVEKVYHAFVDGVHHLEERHVNQPLWTSKKGMSKIDWLKGKESLTVFNTLKAYKDYTLLACTPLSGRLHQIRVHASYIKAPILADALYGGPMVYLSKLKGKRFNLKKDTEELPLISRVALHAYAIAFENLDGSPCIVQAPYPKDMATLIKQLELHNQ